MNTESSGLAWTGRFVPGPGEMKIAKVMEAK